MRKLSRRLSNYRSGGASPSDNYGPQTPPVDRTSNPGPGSYHGGNTPEIKTRRTLQPVDPEEATLEAEVGETVVTNLNHQGIPEFYKIGGKRHSRGGTPLNLPPNSFIFSRDNKMKIKDPNLLKFFGKNPKGKKGYTPADLSKQYDLNKYREILADPNSDKMQRDTAQLMIQNYNLKLGALALAQESIKGFDRGLPAVASPMLQKFGIEPKTLIEGVKPQDSMQQNKRVAQIDMAQKKGQMPKALFGRETQLESKMVTKNENNVWNQMWNNPDAMTGAVSGLANIFNSTQGPEMADVLAAPNVFNEMPAPGGDFAFNQSAGYVGEDTPVQNMGNIYSQSGQSLTKFGGGTFKFGGSYATGGMTNPNDMSTSCPKGQAWNGILGKCVPIEELRMFYRSMNPTDPRRNSVLSELSEGRTNTDGYWSGLIDGDAYSDHLYHIGSQISKEFGPGGYAWGNPRPKFRTQEYYDKPTIAGKIAGMAGKVINKATNKEMHGGEPHNYDNLGDINTIPGMSDAAIAYQNSLSGAEPVPGPVDYTFMDVNAPSGREGFTMIHGVDNGVAENQYWVPDAQATGVIDHSKLKGNYPLVTNSDGTAYTLSQGAGYGDVTENDNSITSNPIDEFRQTPPPPNFWSGGANGAEPTLEEGERISGNNIFDASGNIVGYKNDGNWVQYAPAGNDEAVDEKTVETSTKSTKLESIPKDTDAEFFDPDSDGFDESLIEEGDYIKKEGKWHKVTQVKADPYKGEAIESLPEVLKGESSDLREDYGRLKHMIESNDDVRKEIISRYRKKMEGAKAGRFMSSSDIAVAKGHSDEKIIENFLDSQLQVMAINANKGMIRGSEGEAAWDKTVVTDKSSKYYGLPKSYVESALALNLEPKSKGDTYGFQTAYIELEKMANDPKYKDVLKDFILTGDTQWGTADETVEGVSNRTVSPADGWWGNTTTGQAALYNPEGKDWKYEEVGIDTPEEELEVDGLEGVEREVPYGWTAPDTMQLGFDVKNRLGLKKYRPWVGKDIPTYLTPRFTSMEQPISKVNAQVMGALEGAGRLAQPSQSFGATASALGKTSADAIIDAGFKEQTYNIGQGAAADKYNTDLANSSNRLNNGLAKSLYDGNTIMNQNFDNAKRAIGQRFVTDYGTGWKNASNLQVMNTRDPNYNINAWTGKQYGTFKEGDLAPTYNPQQDLATMAQKLMEDIPSLTGDKALEYAYKTLNPSAKSDNNLRVRGKLSANEIAAYNNNQNNV